MPPALKVIPGSAHPALAGEVARELGESLARVEIGLFAEGEDRERIIDDVRGAHAVIVLPTGPPVNDNLMVLALLANAAKTAGAVRVTAVVPYFGYARQDRREHVGEPRSAQVAGYLLAVVGSITSSPSTSTARRWRVLCRCRPRSSVPTRSSFRGSPPGGCGIWSSCRRTRAG